LSEQLRRLNQNSVAEFFRKPFQKIPQIYATFVQFWTNVAATRHLQLPQIFTEAGKFLALNRSAEFCITATMPLVVYKKSSLKFKKTDFHLLRRILHSCSAQTI